MSGGGDRRMSGGEDRRMTDDEQLDADESAGGAVRLAVRSVRAGVVLIAEEAATGVGSRVLLSAEEAELLADALRRGALLHRRLAASPPEVGHA